MYVIDKFTKDLLHKNIGITISLPAVDTDRHTAVYSITLYGLVHRCVLS